MLIGSQELIHDINSKLILTHIINDGPISRAGLARKLGLTKATVSNIVQQLINRDLIIESGNDNTSRGRKPILLTFNYFFGYVITIDLEKEYITIMISYLNGEDSKIIHYPNNKSSNEIVDYLKVLITHTLNSLSQSSYNVVGICIGIHGVVHNNQIIFTPYSAYTNIDLVTPIEIQFSIPVYLENEANLSIIGEKSFHYNFPNMMGISIHSGVGLGIIINDEIFSGYDGHAGELGHTIIEIDGLPCPCGNKGCFEQYASELALISKFAKIKNVSHATIEMLIESYANEDLETILLVEEFIKYLSIGINNLLNIFNPEIIVINSRLTNEFPDILIQLYPLLKNRITPSCKIFSSKLKDTSILFGGLCICVKKFLGLKSFMLK